MKNLPNKDRCLERVYLPCQSEPKRCMGWRRHGGSHRLVVTGSRKGCTKETPVELEVFWNGLEAKTP